MIRAGRLIGAARVTRHLWRMTLALFIAALSFAGQQKIIPPFLRGLTQGQANHVEASACFVGSSACGGMSDLPPKKWTGLGGSALGFGWADVAQGLGHVDEVPDP
jgi:hypothetical protein